jgi:ribonucleoside-triphosphate reductase
MAVARREVRVVKASGDVEPFSPNVIKNECIEAGIEEFTATEVALEVAKRVYDGISTRDIQLTTLEILYEKDPIAADRYHRFHSMHVRTSKNTIEAFDRRRIVSSLILETGLPKELAEQVAREAESEIRRLKLDFISSPLIREIVNVKLLEHGFEKARADYTRLGMPVYDATQLIKSSNNGNLQKNPETIHKLIADQVFREYSLLKVLPLHLADAHMRGDIYIHDLEYFPTRPYCAHHDLRWFLRNGLKIEGTTNVAGPAKKAEVAILHAAKVLFAAQSNYSGCQGMDFLTVWLAPYIEESSYERIKQLAQMLIYEMSQIYIGRDGQSTIGIEYGVPEILQDVPAILPGGRTKNGITYGDYEEEARLFAKALTEVYLEGDYFGKPFLLPRPNYKLRKENLNKEGYEDFMILVHRVAGKFGTPNFINFHAEYLSNSIFTQYYRWAVQHRDDFVNGYLHASILQVVTINLPRISYEAEGDLSKFYELLDEKLSLAREAIEIKREVIRERLRQKLLPFLSQKTEDGKPYFRLEEVAHGIGYVGLNEAVQSITGSEMHESITSWNLGLKLVRYMSKTTKTWSEESGLRWVLTQAPDISTANRLAKLDYGQFPGKAIVRGDLDSGRIYYTDSSQVRPDADISLLDRLKLEGAFHPIASGGIMSQASADESINEEDLSKLTEEIISKTHVGYWYYVKDVTRCNVCGKFSRGLTNYCHACGSTTVEHYSNKIGYSSQNYEFR